MEARGKKTKCNNAASITLTERTSSSWAGVICWSLWINGGVLPEWRWCH